MKIVMLLDNSFRPDPRVAREAKALTESGHDVTVYAWDRDLDVARPGMETQDGYSIFRIPVKTRQQLGALQFLRFIVYAWKVFWKVMQDDFDVIHCHDLLNLPIGFIIKCLRRVMLVYDAHEIYWIMEADKYPTILLKLFQFGELFLLNWVDVFITVGRNRQKYYENYISKEIHVVGNWYNPELRNETLRESFRKKIGINDGDFVVGLIGSLTHKRSLDSIIECARSTNPSEMGVHWIVAGSGSEERKFINAESEGINLHFLGWIRDLAPVYSACDAFIYLLDESLPYSNYASPNNLFLSIAWAIPLITNNAGEMREILVPINAGIFLEKNNHDKLFEAISLLKENPTVYQGIVEKLLELQHVYSWDESATRLLKAYMKLDNHIEKNKYTEETYA